MATVPVSQLKQGERIIENVMTKFNNVLFTRGKVVTERDLEILRAFMIPSVQIDSKNLDAEEAAGAEAGSAESAAVSLPFHDWYERMLQLLRRIFKTANSGGQNLPILDIRTTLEGLIKHIDQYDILTFNPKQFQLQDFVYHNSIMVSLTSYHLAKWAGMPVKDLLPIALGGLFHDIGTAKIDPAILYKPTKLSVQELEEMKQHTVIGYNILKSVPAINEGVKLCALQHHEREDGSGYPLGARGDKIHMYAKIVAISDMFHAMRTDRFHKKGISPYLVLEQLQDEAFGKMEPVLVQTFVQKITSFQNGMLVKLSDNSIGEIVFSDRAHPTRPWVNVNGNIVNLTTARSLYIQDVIQK
ncbi:HD domain-containing protein [Paenibacillus sp. UNCCL117]|uniref:HD-GYP domain-containing protein n=1 Tax=unclassified Paenibacillus TaxID=185978 RepID=UPI00088BDACA|nr:MULTISPECIES: HD-GYP domain-containing protein [unclassified Paenibacillus]SDD87440.1 HD domain-containing protein [Paenibacillus sp. cl123]SFW53930.1 HD domain-containing protein [Paenibacillus sp. UNCCL117]